MADNTSAPIIPLNLQTAEELNRRCSDYSRSVESRKIDDAPSDGGQYVRQDGAWVPLTNQLKGFYDQVADSIVGGGALDAASNYAPGEYYRLTVSGVFSTSIPELSGLNGIEGDTINSNGTQWIYLTASSDFLSSVADDTAAGVITFTPAPKSSSAPVAADELTRKDYVDLGDVVDRNHADAQDAAHVADPDPHPQYTLEAQAIQAFTGIGYGGMFSNTQRSAPSLGGGWQIIEFDTPAVVTPVGVVIDTATNQFSITREGVFMLNLSFTFEHNSSNQGRVTNVRLWDVTQGIENNRIVLATGRNAEASSFTQLALLEIGPTNLGDFWRFEIGDGDSYTSVQWDQTNMSIFSVGEWRGVL